MQFTSDSSLNNDNLDDYYNSKFLETKYVNDKTIFELQSKDENLSISESDTFSSQKSLNINKNEGNLYDSYQDDISQIFVRSVSKTCQFTLQQLVVNLSIDQLHITNRLINNIFLHQQQQINESSQKLEESKGEQKQQQQQQVVIEEKELNLENQNKLQSLESEVSIIKSSDNSQQYYLHSGKLIRCCGDYRSSLISSTILKRFIIILITSSSFLFFGK